MAPRDTHAQKDKSHTIILVQKTQSKASRTFLDYNTISGAVDSICGMFERDLKERFSHQRELTYDVQQLFQWIDHLHDLSALVWASKPLSLMVRVGKFDDEKVAYLPYNKAWVKEKVLSQLKRQAGLR